MSNGATGKLCLPRFNSGKLSNQYTGLFIDLNGDGIDEGYFECKFRSGYDPLENPTF